MMSTRCKVCNSAKNTSQENSDMNWECENCGNLLDSKGHIATI
jgi:ribosomal protein L37AE/L43A